MKRKIVIGFALLLFSFNGVVAAQGKLSQLRTWVDKYPTHKAGRITKNFFQAPVIQRELLRLLTRRDFNLLTRTYKVETPIKAIGDFLVVKVCRPHSCDSDQGGFAINLRTGFVYVRMHAEESTRWFSSRDPYTELPQNVQDYLNDFSAT